MSLKGTQYLKPTAGKLALTIFFVAWQYFYSYQNYGIEFFSSNVRSLGVFWGYFDWGSSLSRIFSLLALWAIVAVIIFFGIWTVEAVSVFFHNKMVERKYVNRPAADYEHLLRHSKSILDYLKNRSLWAIGILLILVSLFFISDGLEGIRQWAIDAAALWSFDHGYMIDWQNSLYLTLSFVLFTFIWYWISLFVVSIFKIQLSEEKKEEITKDHFAVDVKTDLPKDSVQ